MSVSKRRKVAGSILASRFLCANSSVGRACDFFTVSANVRGNSAVENVCYYITEHWTYNPASVAGTCVTTERVPDPPATHFYFGGIV